MLDKDLEPPCAKLLPNRECPDCCENMEWDFFLFNFKCSKCLGSFEPIDEDDEYDENWRYVYDY